MNVTKKERRTGGQGSMETLVAHLMFDCFSELDTIIRSRSGLRDHLSRDEPSMYQRRKRQALSTLEKNGDLRWKLSKPNVSLGSRIKTSDTKTHPGPSDTSAFRTNLILGDTQILRSNI